MTIALSARKPNGIFLMTFYLAHADHNAKEENPRHAPPLWPIRKRVAQEKEGGVAITPEASFVLTISGVGCVETRGPLLSGRNQKTQTAH